MSEEKRGLGDPVYVRYVYLTPKGKELLESIEKALQNDVALELISEDVDVPLPPRKMRRSGGSE